MSADVVAYLPTLDDPTWVAWQAAQITRIARTPRAVGFRYRERELITALGTSFNARLDQWHTWEWFDAIGGVITVDPEAPESHPHLGVIPIEELTFDAITEAQQSLLRQALADTAERISR